MASSLIRGKDVFLESLIMTMPVGMIALDKDLRITLINPRACENLEIPLQEADRLPGRFLPDLLPEERDGEVSKRLLKGNYRFDLTDVRMAGKDLSLKCRPIPDGVLLTVMNISKLKEIEINTYHAVLEGQEAERRRLAREIHDGIGPLLSVLRLNIEHLQSQVAQPSESLETGFQHVQDIIHQLTQDMRNIAHTLLPAILVDFGLDTALQQLCGKLSVKGKVAIDFYSSNQEHRFDPSIELGLYRIGQELLNNALKHARARSVTMQLIRHERSIVLMVEDDGQGFDPVDLDKHTEGIGLKDINARIKSMNGHFNLETAPGQGVLVSVEVPFGGIEELRN